MKHKKGKDITRVLEGLCDPPEAPKNGLSESIAEVTTAHTLVQNPDEGTVGGRGE